MCDKDGYGCVFRSVWEERAGEEGVLDFARCDGRTGAGEVVDPGITQQVGGIINGIGV